MQSSKFREAYFKCQPHFVHSCYHYYARQFSPDIINAARKHFDIALWFSSLDHMEIKKFIARFEWLKNEDFVFIWGREKCICHTMYSSSMYAYNIGEVQLHNIIIYKKSLKDVFIQYGDIYQKSEILFIDEGKYHLEDNSKDNCLKIPSSWTFDGSQEREIHLKTMLCSVLNHLGPCSNMGRWLKTFKFR